MKKLALLVAATLVSLLAVEGFLRLTGLGLIRPEIQFGAATGSHLDTGFFVTDPDLFWREPAGPPDELHLGSHYVRVGDAIPPRDERLRIIGLGDSCSRLSMTNRTWTVALQEALGDRAEVFNASLPGYTSFQGLAWLRKQLLDFAPDLVVVYFGWNDHWRSWGYSDSEYARRLSPAYLRLPGLFVAPPAEPPLRLTPAEYRQNLVAIADEVAAVGGRVVVVLAPHALRQENRERFLANGTILPGDDPQGLHDAYLAVARSLDRHPAVRLYDAAGQFTAMGEPELLLQRDGIHPTDPGHAVLGGTLADDIRRNELGGRFAPLDIAAYGLGTAARELSAGGHWADAARFYRRAVELAPADLGPRLGLAWLLSTCPVDSVRDGEGALAVLAPVSDRGRPSAEYHDVRGAALAEAGRFEEAQESARTALVLRSARSNLDDPFADAIRERQAGYARGEAYRVEAAPARR